MQEIVESKITEIAYALFDHLNHEGCEFYVFRDGYYGIRQERSFSPCEDEVIFKIPLSSWYWRDTLWEWNLLDSNGRIREDVTDEEQKDFIQDAILPDLEGMANSLVLAIEE